MSDVTAGYEGPFKEPERTGEAARWTSRRVEHYSSAACPLQILRDGVAVGVLFLASDAEVQWLQSNHFPQEIGDVGILSKSHSGGGQEVLEP